jgi:hypothetical protein
VSKIHLATPVAPKTAACCDITATRFTMWRWQCTCETCKLITAARPMDAVRDTNVLHRADLPIRYSRLVQHVRAHATLPDVEAAIAEFECERQLAARCPRCGPILDPIALLDVPANRMVFACPNCTTGAVRARWEAEQ